MLRYRHVALLVPDLRAAERYYLDLFEMVVLFRESPLQPGGPHTEHWATLPSENTWDDALTAGVPIGMVALQRDDFILPLFEAEPSRTQTYAIGLVMDRSELARIRSRLPTDARVETEEDGWLAFVDPFGVRWQLSDTAAFRSTGETQGRWLDLSGGFRSSAPEQS